MDASLQSYIVLTVVGLVLVALEIFLPGGVMGIIGGIMLFISMALGFSVFGPIGGLVSVTGVAIGGSFLLFLWIKLFPRTGIGRRMTLEASAAGYHGNDTRLDALVEKSGKAVTDLRPAGKADIEGKKVNVVSQGGWIEKGTLVKVVDISGNRVVVRKVLES